MNGLEPTIIRNLTDHFGNNLLHKICINGHYSLLPWLTSRFDNELAGALTDQNRKRLTPPTAAVKVRLKYLILFTSPENTRNNRITIKTTNKT